MGRKTIAMCVTGYDDECEARITEGVRKECAERGYNLLLFHPLVRKPNLESKSETNENIIRGENEIFNLINYDITDGIILAGENFIDSKMPDRIIKEANKRNIPVVNVNDTEHVADCNVTLSDDNAMELIMRHLVEHHGYRVINFVGGFPGNQQTEERLDAYKRVLLENGIPVEEERIGYGNFWNKSIEVTENFMKAEKKPEAIVYANDTMAMFGMDYLESQGYKIPEDVAITGFDGVKDIYTTKPTLTSARRNFLEAGIKAVEIVDRMIAGEKFPEKVNVEAELIKNESCGCINKVGADTTGYIRKKYGDKWNFLAFNSYLQKMNILFSEAATSTDIYNSIDECAEFFGVKRMFICICDRFENNNGNLLDLSSRNRVYGLTNNMVSMAGYGHKTPSKTLFSRKNYLPVEFLDEEKPAFISFSPMYFKDSFIGYVAVEKEEVISGVGDLWGTWVMQLANNAGSFYMKEELIYVLEQLDKLYTIDSLTGLQNRRGLEKAKSILKFAAERNLFVTCVVADIDNLKIVNDEYGHEGGDVVIRAIADAITNSLPSNSINVRTGGDEFMSFFINEAILDVDEMLDGVQKYLDDYNKNSGMPYKAGCSCGYVTERISSLEDFDEMKAKADERMYAEKRRKKTSRK
ncbi:MAG: GGDEF domain-containing protein [Lachnospiraceae bacterium]|nr:GGDEF domain-containing protein [Lachnospiraceae bacterium]